MLFLVRAQCSSKSESKYIIFKRRRNPPRASKLSILFVLVFFLTQPVVPGQALDIILFMLVWEYLATFFYSEFVRLFSLVSRQQPRDGHSQQLMLKPRHRCFPPLDQLPLLSASLAVAKSLEIFRPQFQPLSPKTGETSKQIVRVMAAVVHSSLIYPCPLIRMLYKSISVAR